MTQTQTLSQMKQRLQVTDDEITRCTRRMTAEGEVYYECKSESSDELYHVYFIKGRGFSCTCPSGQEGFASCHYYPTCKHCRWATCAAAARRERIARLEAMGLTNAEAQSAVDARFTVNGQPADDATLARVFGAQPARPTEAEMNAQAAAYQARPFSLMR